MSSIEVFNTTKDICYWTFQNTLEPLGDMPWTIVLIFGFVAFAYWMKRQMDYNKQAAADPNQIK
jgi:hypothetical protein